MRFGEEIKTKERVGTPHGPSSEQKSGTEKKPNELGEPTYGGKKP